MITRLPVLLLFVASSLAFSPMPSSLQPMTPKTEHFHSPSVLAMGVETTAMLTAIDSFYQTQPYQAAFLTCSVKASAADWVVQVSRQKTDFSRNAAFLLYGGIYQGVFQQFLYNTLFPMWFGTDVTIASVVQQVALDMCLITPLVCLPVAYLVKSSMNAQETLQQGLETYWRHVKQEGLLVKYWMLWIPVQTLTFGVIPQHLRIPFIAAVSFLWIMILSQISSTTTTESSK